MQGKNFTTKNSGGGGGEGRAILCPVASVDMDKPHVGVFPEL